MHRPLRPRLALLSALALALTGLVSLDEPAAAQGGSRMGPSWIDGPASQGEEVAAKPLVAEDLLANIGSKRDGAGMCVNTSIETHARQLGLDGWRGFRDWSAQFGGGSYPEKVDQQLKEYARLKGLPEPRYVQYQGPDPGPILELAARTGRGCCVAYGYSPRYASFINHMVYVPQPHGRRYAAVADNNVFGGLTRDLPKRLEWMDDGELVARMKVGAGPRGAATPTDAWVFVWSEPPTPPSPKTFPAH